MKIICLTLFICWEEPLLNNFVQNPILMDVLALEYSKWWNACSITTNTLNHWNPLLSTRMRLILRTKCRIENNSTWFYCSIVPIENPDSSILYVFSGLIPSFWTILLYASNQASRAGLVAPSIRTDSIRRPITTVRRGCRIIKRGTQSWLRVNGGGSSSERSDASSKLYIHFVRISSAISFSNRCPGEYPLIVKSLIHLRSTFSSAYESFCYCWQACECDKPPLTRRITELFGSCKMLSASCEDLYLPDWTYNTAWCIWISGRVASILLQRTIVGRA